MTTLSGPALLPQSGQAKHLVIFLHGYGADGANLIGLGEAWQPLMPDAVFVAPNAPTPCEMGGSGYQWFSLEEKTTELVQERLRDIQEQVCAYIKSESQKRDIPLENVILVGFSQGAMLAVHQGIYALDKCAGVIGYSGGFSADISLKVKNKPKVLLCHGEADQVVPVAFSQLGYTTLKDMGVTAQLIISPDGGHEISEEGFKAGGLFLKDLL